MFPRHVELELERSGATSSGACVPILQFQAQAEDRVKGWIFQLPQAPENGAFPLYFAKPPNTEENPTYGFFLPRNMAQELESDDSRRFDVTKLKYLNQGSQYTLFQYQRSDMTSCIIKRARINTSTLKYMMREKAMCRYLKHENVAEMSSCFSPPALFKGDMFDARDTADTYIVCDLYCTAAIQS